eukprot:3214690-Pyramimonas_sp.AAC.1
MGMIFNGPSDMRQIQLLLARKHKGPGIRCIAFFSGMLRIKGKLAASECKEWERQYGMGGEFSATQGRSPEDAVWRQS